jgi:hypothetical protein
MPIATAAPAGIFLTPVSHDYEAVGRRVISGTVCRIIELRHADLGNVRAVNRRQPRLLYSEPALAGNLMGVRSRLRNTATCAIDDLGSAHGRPPCRRP